MIDLCTFCFDEPPAGAEACAHPECPYGSGVGMAAPRLLPRTPTRPSLVGGPRATVVPPEEARPVPHIGTQPSLREDRGGRR